MVQYEVHNNSGTISAQTQKLIKSSSFAYRKYWRTESQGTNTIKKKTHKSKKWDML